MATIKDVAERAGVSISTVSRVTNGSESVDAELTVKVKQAVEDLKYTANDLARGLKASTTGKITFIVTTVSRVFFVDILEGIHRVASEHGYSVILAETYDSVEREINLVEHTVAQWTDGIILASSAYEDNKASREYVNHLHTLQKKNRPIPVVSLEFPLNNEHIDAVVIDHEKAAYEAVNHLIRDAGRSHIVHVSLPWNHYLGKERIKGFRRALEEAGLPVSKDSIWQGNYTTYSGFQAAEDMIQSHVPFDAVFCANDQMAVGVMKACEKYGLRIPQDVAIIGNDDIFAASIVTPTLSSIAVPKVEMGATAASQLIEQIEAGRLRDKRKITTLQYQIVARESTTKSDSHNSFEYLRW